MTAPADESLPSIEIKQLKKSFPVGFARVRTVEALRGITLDVRRGTTFGFLGPNGAGKTTTIKTIVGLIFPSEGLVSVLGVAPQVAWARRRMGYLPENPSFHEHLTGREVLRFACALSQLEGRDFDTRINDVLEQVKMSHAADLQVRRYSKGMTQRLGIAQALVHQPDLVILDEPMSGLDPLGRRDIKDLILRLRAEGRTVFFSTHIIADVEEICDEVAILVGGQVVRSGSVTNLLGGENREYEIVATQVPPDFADLDGREASGAVPFVVPSDEAARGLIQRLWTRGARVVSVRTRRYGLEAIFLEEVAKQPVSKRLEE